MGAAMFYIYISRIHNVSWLEWLTVPFTFLFINVLEWAVSCTGRSSKTFVSDAPGFSEPPELSTTLLGTALIFSRPKRFVPTVKLG